MGSVGVVSEFPNVSGLLERHGVRWASYTAGESKRTVTPFKEPTAAERAKYQAQLAQIHRAFIGWVTARRPHFDAAACATGEYWIASAAPPGVVDRTGLSSEFLRAKMEGSSVVLVDVETSQSPWEQLGLVAGSLSALGAELTRAAGPLRGLVAARPS